MEPIGCTETSATNRQSTLCNTPEERRSLACAVDTTATENFQRSSKRTNWTDFTKPRFGWWNLSSWETVHDSTVLQPR